MTDKQDKQDEQTYESRHLACMNAMNAMMAGLFSHMAIIELTKLTNSPTGTQETVYTPPLNTYETVAASNSLELLENPECYVELLNWDSQKWKLKPALLLKQISEFADVSRDSLRAIIICGASTEVPVYRKRWFGLRTTREWAKTITVMVIAEQFFALKEGRRCVYTPCLDGYACDRNGMEIIGTTPAEFAQLLSNRERLATETMKGAILYGDLSFLAQATPYRGGVAPVMRRFVQGEGNVFRVEGVEQ